MKNTRLLLSCAAIGIFGTMLPAAPLLAEDTSCQSLASWYAANPSQVDVDSLIALRSCVNQTIGAQIQQAPQGSRPEDSDTQPQDRGSWPAAPAWSDGRIESKPWDRD